MKQVQTIKLAYPHTLCVDELPETIAAIGFFDGIHKGHQSVIKKAVALAKKERKESAVISFHPHPSVVLNAPVLPVHYITPIDEKEMILSKLGVDRLYMITFNKALSSLSPKEFIDHFIVNLNITHLVAGFDFSFGHKGAGNMQNINRFHTGRFETTTMDKVELDGDKVSSTKIREYLQHGAVHKVSQLLGRPYTATGLVVEGDKRGRQLGFPTANLEISDEKLLPKQGVYAVKAMYKNRLYDGMANLGVKPTFVEGELKPTVEVFLFDFHEDIYAEELIVQWYQYIRDEKKFNGVDEIIAQLKNDECEIRKYFKQ